MEFQHKVRTELLRALINIQEELDAGVRNRRGLCFIIAYESECRYTIECGKLLHDYFEKWPEFSGSLAYPVPSPDKCYSAEEYFLDRRVGKWTGEYGASRRRLLDWLIQQLEEELK